MNSFYNPIYRKTWNNVNSFSAKTCFWFRLTGLLAIIPYTLARYQTPLAIIILGSIFLIAQFFIVPLMDHINYLWQFHRIKDRFLAEVCELALYCREKIDSDGLVDEATADNFRKKMMEFHRRFLDDEYPSSGLMIDVMIYLDGISMELDITNPRIMRFVNHYNHE
jgi:hypothetical protein